MKEASEALIHRSAWNKNSANFAFWAFSEVPRRPGPMQQSVLCRDVEGCAPYT